MMISLDDFIVHSVSQSLIHVPKLLEASHEKSSNSTKVNFIAKYI